MIKFPSVKSSDPYERSLAYFVNHQKYLYKRGKLPKKHYDVLNSIDGWYWDVKKAKECNIEFEKCKELVIWITEKGKMPSKYAKCRYERHWANFMEGRLETSKLPQNQKDVLSRVFKFDK
jgi:hypothetical protein